LVIAACGFETAAGLAGISRALNHQLAIAATEQLGNRALPALSQRATSG
jgi:hypothetical protein